MKKKRLSRRTIFFLSYALGGVLWILSQTLRFRIDDRAGFFAGKVPQPVIAIFWHGALLAMPGIYRRFLRKNRKACDILTSPSDDGEIVAQICARFGLGAVRASSNKNPARGVRELIDRLEQGIDLGVTPDGPRGPRQKIAPGVVYLAEKTGRNIFPITIFYHNAWRLKTWDEFCIPKPFSKVSVIFHNLRKFENHEQQDFAQKNQIAKEQIERDIGDYFVPTEKNISE